MHQWWKISLRERVATLKTSTTESASSELSSQLQAAEDVQTSKVGLVILGSYEQ